MSVSDQSSSVGQQAHNLNPAIGAPGMLYDNKLGNDIISCYAAEDLQFGRFVELDSSDVASDGTMVVRLPQGTTTSLANIIGVVVRDQQREQDTWPDLSAQGVKAGTRVAVLRRGRIFVERDTADTVAVTRLSTWNLMHSSSTATKRGMVTKASTSTSSGAEVDSISSIAKTFEDTSTSGLALLDVFVI
jgi:hypothetical protein